MRSADVTDSYCDVLAFIRRAEKTGNEHLPGFVWRARALIENPSDFDYDQWCRGKLAQTLFNR